MLYMMRFSTKRYLQSISHYWIETVELQVYKIGLDRPRITGPEHII